jgi:uncharacterized membrane protein
MTRSSWTFPSLKQHTPPPSLSSEPTLGERVADRVASFGGSWRFIGLFALIIVLWLIANSMARAPYDPYPFILLNLVLSCLAALQAPIIMMSQNRQAARDRLEAQHDYQVNLIAEEQVLEIHRKLDEMRAMQIAELVTLQRRQMELLEAIQATARSDGEAQQ